MLGGKLAIFFFFKLSIRKVGKVLHGSELDSRRVALPRALM